MDSNYINDLLEKSLSSEKRGYRMVLFLEEDNHPDQKFFYSILDSLGARWGNQYNPDIIMIGDKKAQETIYKYDIKGISMVIGNSDGILEIEGKQIIEKDVLFDKDKFADLLDKFDEKMEESIAQNPLPSPLSRMAQLFAIAFIIAVLMLIFVFTNN